MLCQLTFIGLEITKHRLISRGMTSLIGLGLIYRACVEWIWLQGDGRHFLIKNAIACKPNEEWLQAAAFVYTKCELASSWKPCIEISTESLLDLIHFVAIGLRWQEDLKLWLYRLQPHPRPHTSFVLMTVLIFRNVANYPYRIVLTHS